MSYYYFDSEKSSRMEKEYLNIKRTYSNELNIPYYPKTTKPLYYI